jgi:hypothetical protein
MAKNRMMLSLIIDEKTIKIFGGKMVDAPGYCFNKNCDFSIIL